MFDALSDRLGNTFDRLRGRGALREQDVRDAMREVRIALLEADVALPVARDFIEKVTEKAVGEAVLKSVTPGQQVVKIVNDELVAMLGGSDSEDGHVPLTLDAKPPVVIMMVGLQGSGKTTSTAKLGKLIREKHGKKAMMASLDVNRPAAQEQLAVLGEQAQVDTLPIVEGQQPVDIAKRALESAKLRNVDVVLLDTAGRLHVDEALMAEMKAVASVATPTEVLLVVDSLTGQDAVNAATDFDERIGITGLVLSKLDGDARGGAALSVVSVTGVPIKFLGAGERVDALEQFYPDRLASRILGMGDMLTFIEKAQANFDESEAAELEKKIRQATFDLDDFLGQLQQLKRMGPLSQILEMVPGMSSITGKIPEGELGEDQIKKVEAVIYSMTPEERRRPEMIGGSRRRRIARGSGTTPQDINQLLNQFRQMQKLMRQMASGKGLQNLTRMMR